MYKLNITIRSIFIICGLIAPWPIFFELSSRSFILENFSVNTYKSSSSGAVPIGYFFLVFSSLLAFYHGYKYKVLTNIEKYEILFYCFWVAFLLFYIPFERVISLTSIFFILIFFKIGKKTSLSFKGMTYGYLISLLFLFGIKLFDTNFCGFFICDAFHSRSILGYEIYQYFVSYSAVMSLICSACLIGVYFTKPPLLSITLLLISFFAYGEVALTYRKAPLVELFFCFSIVLIIFFKFTPRSLNKFKGFCILSLTAIFLTGLLVNITSKREHLGIEAFMDRLNTYFIALEVVSTPKLNDIQNKSEGQQSKLEGQSSTKLSDSQYYKLEESINNENDTKHIKKFLLGYKTGWGGYGNSFIEFFIRMGFCGLLFFIISLLLLFRNLIILSGLKIQKNYQIDDIKALSILSTFIFSMLLGNMVNLNIQLPYFFSNWIILFFSFTIILNLKNSS